MKFHNLILIVVAACVLSQCKKHHFKPDQQDPALPSYTENGAGFGGAFINDSAWLTFNHQLFVYSSRKPLVVEAFPTGDSIVIWFDGDFKAFMSSSTYPPTTIFLVLKNIKVERLEDIAQLNGYTFVLDGVTRYGGVLDFLTGEKKGTGTGQIAFGKVVVDEHYKFGDTYAYIISGKFNMDFSADRDYSVAKGRFDFYLENNYSFYIRQ